MKQKGILKMLLLAVFAVFVLASCDNDEDTTIELTQEKLDAVTNMIGTYTGFSAGEATVAHNGGVTSTPDSTVREVYASIADVTGDLAPGTIITKKVWDKNFTNNTKGEKLFVTLAMIKREAGYDAANGDWEYVMMPAGETTDYTAHPFGILPEAESDMRGKLQMCISCHAKDTDGDFIFVDDI